MPTIYIDNKPYNVASGQNLLQACLSLGFDLPYFCWHPAMHSAGACRQCAVKQFRDEHDMRGKIVMACMTPVADNMRISVDDPEARAFRKGIIEFLMANHPHDCPVCDEGGECHLQDMTVMAGHVARGYRFKKRTYRNQYLGPFINHEINRCIQCFRCVRFYRDYAGGRDLEVFGSHGRLYFGRHEDGMLMSEFSGNLVEVCPTGVFTDKTLKRHYTRKWDLQTSPTICVHCGLGCNIIAGERYGSLRRILNRYNREVNGYFICDRGRFGYDFVNSGHRLTRPHIGLRCNSARGIDVRAAIERAVEMVRGAKGIIGIGSPRASLESNFALRSLVGPSMFFSGMSVAEHRIVQTVIDILRHGPAPAASLRDAEETDAVLILGEDVPNTGPRLALSLRQAVRNKPMEIAKRLGIPVWNDIAVRHAVQDEKGLLFIASPMATRIDDIAASIFRAAPHDIARLGFAICHEIEPEAPHVSDLSNEDRILARGIAEGLLQAERPLIVSGTGLMSEDIVRAAGNIAWLLRKKRRDASLFFVLPECNSMGLAMLGPRPLSEALDAVKRGEADTVIILENDLYRRAERTFVNAFLGAFKQVIVLDQISTPTVMRSDLALPAASFAESDGTLISSEARAQRFFKVYDPSLFDPEKCMQESWRWLRSIMKAVAAPGYDGWSTWDGLVDAVSAEIPELMRVKEAAPASGFRIEGMKIPRQPHRYSGRTSMTAHLDIHEHEPRPDLDSPLAFSMEGYQGIPPAPLTARYWAPGWNSVQSLNRFQQEVGGPLIGGCPGKRLIEPSPEGAADHLAAIPEPFAPTEGILLFIPLYHVFGTEELSSLSGPVSEVAPGPCVVINRGDAEMLGIMQGMKIEIVIKDVLLQLPARLSIDIAKGVAGIYAGLKGAEWVDLPQYGIIKKGT